MRALATVTVELVDVGADREEVFRRLSNDQLGEADLVLSTHVWHGALFGAASSSTWRTA